MPLFDPKTFTAEQLASLNNVEGQSLSATNTPEQIQTAQSMTMTPDNLSQATPYNIQQTVTPLAPDVTALQSQLDATYAPTQAEQQQSTISSDLLNTYNTLVGISSDTSKLQESTGLNRAQQNFDELSGQLNALITERKSIPLQLQERSGGITTSVLGAMTEGELRKNAIAALGVSALMDASKGMIDSAQRKVDQAISAKYDPIRARQAALEAQLNLIKNDPATSLQDKQRADARLAIQAKITAAEAQKKENEKSIWDITLKAASNSGSFTPTQEYSTATQVLSAMRSAPSPIDATLIAVRAGMLSPENLPAIASEYAYAKSQGFKGGFIDYQKLKATQFGTKKTTPTTEFNYDKGVTSLQNVVIPVSSLNKNGTLASSYSKKVLDAGVTPAMSKFMWDAIVDGHNFEEIRQEIIKNGADPKVLDTFVQALQE